MYRDDHDALLSRAESLQRELDDKKARLEAKDDALEETEAQLEAREKELAAIRRRLAKLERKQQPNAKKPVMLAVAAAGVCMVGGVVAFLMMAAGAPDESAPQATTATRPTPVAPAPPPPPPPAPATPDPAEVKRAFRTATAAIRQCVQAHPDCTGTIELEGTISASGRLLRSRRATVSVKVKTRINGKEVATDSQVQVGDGSLTCKDVERAPALESCVWDAATAVSYPTSQRGAAFSETVVVRVD